jgi:hypothetical protein
MDEGQLRRPAAVADRGRLSGGYALALRGRSGTTSAGGRAR